MKLLTMKTKVNVVHVQKKSMKDQATAKEVIYYEVSILAPSIFEGLEKATSGSEFRVGEQMAALTIKPSGDNLKLKISGQTDVEVKK